MKMVNVKVFMILAFVNWILTMGLTKHNTLETLLA